MKVGVDTIIDLVNRNVTDHLAAKRKRWKKIAKNSSYVIQAP